MAFCRKSTDLSKLRVSIIFSASVNLMQPKKAKRFTLMTMEFLDLRSKSLVINYVCMSTRNDFSTVFERPVIF